MAVARTRRVVFVSLATQILETAALVVAAIATGSSALVAQTFGAGSDIAVHTFLGIGVSLSMREPDETHPFGYGRECYFWSLFGALAVFVSGFAVVIEEALRGALSPAGRVVVRGRVPRPRARERGISLLIARGTAPRSSS